MIRAVLIALILSFCGVTTFAQENESRWYVPDHYKLQFAGRIGFLSVGAGYLHGKGKLETDLHAGYVPKSIGGDYIETITVKSTFFPWNNELGSGYSIRPFSVGLYLSYSFGSEFDTILPDVYPDGYYWWATSLRFGGYLGGSISKDLPNSGLFQNITLYYELGTYDLLFLSYIQNLETIRIYDITSLALGIKLPIR